MATRDITFAHFPPETIKSTLGTGWLVELRPYSSITSFINITKAVEDSYLPTTECFVQGVHGVTSPAASRRSSVVCSPLRRVLAPPSSLLLSRFSRCVKGRAATVRPSLMPPLSPAKSSIVSATTRIGVSWTKYEKVVGDEGTHDLAHGGDGEASRFGYAN
ncbi:hypothetical protein V8G54_018236 [Vigna mungo]|uniref:Uncharacterized protein n=1 Tax=Vigna mungo TaxID=3915 RepID=A0AAQ3N7T1_VIGMU